QRALANRASVLRHRTQLATMARRRRDVHIGMYAVATLGPFAHDYRPRAAATKNQPILPARSEILFGKSFLFVFLFVAEWRNKLFSVNEGHCIHVVKAALSANRENHCLIRALRGGCISRLNATSPRRNATRNAYSQTGDPS